MYQYKQILAAFLGLCALSCSYGMQTQKIHEMVFENVPADQHGTLLQYMTSFKQAKDVRAHISAETNTHDCDHCTQCSLREINATITLRDIIVNASNFLYDYDIECDEETVYNILGNPILLARLGNKEANDRLSSYTDAEQAIAHEAGDAEKRNRKKSVSFSPIE